MLDLAATQGLQVIVLSCNPADYHMFGATEIDLRLLAEQAPKAPVSTTAPVAPAMLLMMRPDSRRTLLLPRRLGPIWNTLMPTTSSSLRTSARQAATLGTSRYGRFLAGVSSDTKR